MRVLRFDLPDGGKCFAQIHPVRNGWKVGRPPGPTPLYRGPEVDDRDVVVVEGEKCADIARDTLGLNAVASAGGSNAAKRTNWKPLASRNVWIVRDEGDAGQEYAASVAKLLDNLDPPATSRIVRLPGLRDGEDIEQFADGRRPDEVREEIERLAAATAQVQFGDDVKVDADEFQPVLVNMADVVATPIAWFWDRRIAVGSLTGVFALPGLGKGFVTRDIAARLSTGTGFPDNAHERQEPGGTVLVVCEDDLQQTIKPHLEKSGADCTKINVLPMIRRADGSEVLVDLRLHLPAISEALRRTPNAKLLVIDPFGAYINGVNANDHSEVYGVLAPLIDLAKQESVAVLLVHHLNKTKSPSALQRQMGSVGITAALRNSWYLTEDPNDPTHGRKLFLHGKHSLGPVQDGLRFTIDPPGIVSWMDGGVAMNADDAFAADAEQSRDSDPRPVDEAIEWLRTVLGDGPMQSADLDAKARAEGHSKRTLDRGKKKLGVKAFQNRDDNGQRIKGWTVTLPAEENGRVPDDE